MSERVEWTAVRRAAVIAAASAAVAGFGCAQAAVAAPTETSEVAQAAGSDTALGRVIDRVLSQADPSVNRPRHDSAV